MKVLVVVLAIIGLTLAEVKKTEYVKQEKHYKEEKQYKKETHGVVHNKQYSYYGMYPGKCDKDGFYYKDDKNFVICSNNNAYVQPCAPGSRNSAFEKYHQGSAYYYRDFCDINLVDHGYGVNHYGYDKKAPKFTVSYDTPYEFHGEYSGKCYKDGFYYNGHDSFVICSNNNAYVQPCAPGTRNSAYGLYYQGSAYYYRDFCDINLVDHGYGVQHGYGHKVYDEKKYGHDDKKYGYEEKKYGYEEKEYGYGQPQYGGYPQGHEYGYGREEYHGKAFGRRPFGIYGR